MGFKKGQSGNPSGRPPGIVSPKTKDFRMAVKKLIDGLDDDLENWVRRVAKKNPARAVDCVVALAEYATPKLTRITHEGDQNRPVLFKRVYDDLIDPNEPRDNPPE